VRLFLGLGSNLGERDQHLAQAVIALSRLPGVTVGRRSSLYQSVPVGPPQPDFLNAVVEITTTHEPLTLLRLCKRIERDLGRVPTVHWGPRVIDLDLVLADEVIAEPTLQVPHLEMHKRAFVLEPLCALSRRRSTRSFRFRCAGCSPTSAIRGSGASASSRSTCSPRRCGVRGLPRPWPPEPRGRSSK
jgi:2-amino-4-hydroxy-6-hydroxymethyldihydropteridine diphosphokinase